MADSERLLLFLAGGDPEQLLDDVRATRSPALLQYARSWLSLVAQDFRAELQSALTTARGADEGSRATKATRLAMPAVLYPRCVRCIFWTARCTRFTSHRL